MKSHGLGREGLEPRKPTEVRRKDEIIDLLASAVAARIFASWDRPASQARPVQQLAGREWKGDIRLFADRFTEPTNFWAVRHPAVA